MDLPSFHSLLKEVTAAVHQNMEDDEEVSLSLSSHHSTFCQHQPLHSVIKIVINWVNDTVSIFVCNHLIR